MTSKPVPQLQVDPPNNFSFKVADWPKWKHRFELFRTISGLAENPESAQIATLRYMMGEEMDDIWSTPEFTDNKKDKYDVAMKKIDAYFICLQKSYS